jgi:hypothetical protein
MKSPEVGYENKGCSIQNIRHDHYGACHDLFCHADPWG